MPSLFARLAALRPTTRLAAAVTVLGCLAAPMLTAPAQASAYPTQPTGVRLAAATSTSLRVTANNSLNASSYTLLVSTNKQDVYYSNLRAGRHTSALHWATASSPDVTVSGLRYTTAMMYWRLAANNGSRHSFSANYHQNGLQPATPGSLNRTLSGVDGATLTWRAGSMATGYTIDQATDPGMTQNLVRYSVGNIAESFTPYQVSTGGTYYFHIRAMTNGTPSAWTAPIAATVTQRQQSMLVATYNILVSSSDNTLESGGRISPWSQRGPAQAALIKHVNPDVLAVQEGNDSIGGNSAVRQVDSLRAYLGRIGADYTVAHTETTYTESRSGVPGLIRTGSYLLYKTSTYSPVGNGGHLTVGDNHWAAWQELRNRATGAQVLVVSAHLCPGTGASWDALRQTETRSLIGQVQAIASARRVPVVYAGDFNSGPNIPRSTFDGTGTAMSAAHVNDGYALAQHRTNAQYDSQNEYRRTPYAYGFDIDHVYPGPGVGLGNWGMAMPLVRGSFVGAIPSDHNPIYATVYFSY